MGYSTQFVGAIGLVDPTVDQIAAFSKIAGADVRFDLHPPLDPNVVGFYHLHLQLTPDFSGIEWDGTEKTNDMVEMLVFVHERCGLQYRPGDVIQAQGEEVGDRWLVRIDADGVPRRRAVVVEGRVIECPDCGHQWEDTGEEATDE